MYRLTFSGAEYDALTPRERAALSYAASSGDTPPSAGLRLAQRLRTAARRRLASAPFPQSSAAESGPFGFRFDTPQEAEPMPF
jgi:hypothetical protein